MTEQALPARVVEAIDAFGFSCAVAEMQDAKHPEFSRRGLARITLVAAIADAIDDAVESAVRMTTGDRRWP